MKESSVIGVTVEHARAAPIARHRAHRAPMRHHCCVALAQGCRRRADWFSYFSILGPSTLRDTSSLAIDSGIRYGIYYAVDPFQNVDERGASTAGVSTLEAVDKRHQERFRYYQSAYPFEYYMVRFFYHEKRELEIAK